MGMANITPYSVLHSTEVPSRYSYAERKLARQAIEAKIREDEDARKERKRSTLKVPKNSKIKGKHAKPFYASNRW